MRAYYLTGPMRQYETWSENLMKTMPKHPRPYGIKRPENWALVATAATIIVVLVVAAELFM